VTLIVDASVVVAALVDSGQDGVWAEQVMLSDQLAAPHLMPAEVTNVLRRALLAGDVSEEVASISHGELLAWRVDLFPYEPFADRIWELRSNLSAYDAWYVAIAEELGASLATLDARLRRSQGPRCTFVTPR
jgi:predicted nucleic acid-binding protein